MEELFRGTWYRSAVKIEKGTRFFGAIGKKKEIDFIVPVPPFESYNPFDWYFSANEARQGKRSLYLEFLAVDTNKPEEVATFCQRFGVLGDPIQAKTYAIKSMRTSAKEFVAGYEGLRARQKKDHLTYMERSVSTALCTPEVLCPPLAVLDFIALQQTIRGDLNNVAPLPEAVLTDVPHTFFKEFLSHGINSSLTLSDVRPGIGWNIQENNWELSWHSFSLIGYLWTMVMLDQLGQGKIMTCPRCHKFFMTASNRMKYCSPSCYENFKVQKYLKKKKESQLAVQKGKKGKAAQATTRKK
ncbi:MAG: hypothetical protein NPIRA06_04740 [Nitrospirales bacterium]|nr:MAG: hypothetical protein NPIRA06_04740 [Nitrospirales bacterium]